MIKYFLRRLVINFLTPQLIQLRAEPKKIKKIKYNNFNFEWIFDYKKIVLV